MVSTYPELKNASSYCRNPRGSGQRPWCFTSDKNKRWEYCDIPSCLSGKNDMVLHQVIRNQYLLLLYNANAHLNFDWLKALY